MMTWKNHGGGVYEVVVPNADPIKSRQEAEEALERLMKQAEKLRKGKKNGVA